MKDFPSIEEIQRLASDAAFGRPLITNVHRGLIAEAIVAAALKPAWKWCSNDYASWDFEREDGHRLEVKQSAARQSWATSDTPSICSFDIAARTGRWEGALWRDEPGRSAHIYVFAHHAVADMSADHRDAGQWAFFVVPKVQLPMTKRISIVQLKSISTPCDYNDLQERVDVVCR